MPVDLAMHMGLNRHPPVRQFLGTSTHKPYCAYTRPSICDSLWSRTVRYPQIPVSPGSSVIYTSPCGTLKKKKRVVFADAKGLALTVVRIYNSDSPISGEEVPPPPVKINTEPSVQSKKFCIRLGFTQPSADLPSFTESLSKTLVRLESCCLVYGSLFGKVRVCNITPEKAVHVHMTYDSWKSHQDIPCTHIPQKYESAQAELFVFTIPLPSSPNVHDRMEFCVSFRPGCGNMLFWDYNGGQNYRILVEEMNSEDVSLVKKKTLMPQNSHSPQSLSLRHGRALYKSASLSTLTRLGI